MVDNRFMETHFLLQIVDRVGNNRLATLCGCSPQYISKLRKEFEMGIRTLVPPAIVLPICAADEWRATPHQVRPDLYPHPDDGLPLAKRGLDAEVSAK